MPTAIYDCIVTDFTNLLKNSLSYHNQSQKLEKPRKSLTRENYTTLFRILGKSQRPLSSYQIKKEMEKAGMQESESPYVYTMIDELVPKHEDKNDVFLFTWNRLPYDKKEKQNVVRVLDSFFKLDWALDRGEEKIRFDKSYDDKIVTIKHELSNTIVKIERDLEPSYGAVLSIIDKNREEDIKREKHRIYIIKEGDKVALPLRIKYESLPPMRYLDEYYRYKIHYLNHDLDNRSEYLKSIMEVRHKQLSRPSKPLINSDEREQYDLFPQKPSDVQQKIMSEIMKLNADRRKWRYSLNIRGFVKYLLGEIELEKRYHKIHNKRISKVLENLSYNYSEEFPFLMCYNEFKNEYDLLRISAELPKYYEVELLKRIAEELQYQVDTADTDFLKYWVTRRYSGELTYYIISAGRSRILEDERDLRYLSFKKIHDYQARCLYFMKQYLESEVVNIKNRYEGYLLGEYPDIYF